MLQLQKLFQITPSNQKTPILKYESLVTQLIHAACVY
jgi:hypothetical protein